MDEQARRSARTRAAIAFVLAGVLLVLNVVAAVAWRDERRERFEDRIGFERGGQQDRDQDGPWSGPTGPGGRMGPGQMPGWSQGGPGQGQQDDQVGPDAGRSGDRRSGQGGTDGQGQTDGQDDTDGQDGTA